MDKKTVLYCRVSTDAQFEDGYSIEAQKELLEAHCKSRQITNYETYVDGGYSGGNLQRPMIQQVIEEAKQGKISGVIVYKLDRISRSQKDTMYLIEDVFLPNNVNFVSINESFDTSTPFGRAMVGILSVFAQLERDNIRMRTRMGMQKRVEEGYWMGGSTIPYGYDYDKNKGILVPNQDAENVKKMYDLYLMGYSCDRIAKMFDLKYDKLVHQILTRKSNTGVICYRGNEYPGKHEALISKEKYEATMREMKKRSEKRERTDTDYLLTGMIYCGKCGAKMRYQKWSSEKTKIVCYSQQKSKQYLVKNPNCDNTKNWSDEVEEAVLNDMFSHFRIKLNEKDVAHVDKPTSALTLLKQKREALQSKIKNLYLLFADNPDDDLRMIIADKKKELEDVDLMILQESDKVTINESATSFIERFSDLQTSWKYMTTQERRMLLRALITKILIFDNRIVVHYNL